MKKMVFVALLVCAGCQTQEEYQATPKEIPQYDPQNPTAWCLAASDVLANPWLDDYRKVVLLETMRNRGCMK
ncbi:hypothetical protein [Celeribacter halophilus]|uniref:hypothetical protein n=1 Tax=Celeribacter halophilus TaxID=576117 RepID=UPI003A8D51FC